MWWIIFERKDVPTFEPNHWPFGYTDAGKFNGTPDEARQYAESAAVQDASVREVVLFPMDTAIRVTKTERVDAAMTALLGNCSPSPERTGEQNG